MRRRDVPTQDDRLAYAVGEAVGNSSPEDASGALITVLAAVIRASTPQERRERAVEVVAEALRAMVSQ